MQQEIIEPTDIDSTKLIEIKKPILPSEWKYDISVGKMKGWIVSWKKVTADILMELWIAREILSKQGLRTDLTSGQMSQSWKQYCIDIGLQKRTANRWLKKWTDDDNDDEPEKVVKTIPDLYKLIEGDCLKEIPKIDDKSIDLLITDPPYNMGKGDWDDFDEKSFYSFTKKWITICLPKLKDEYNIFISFNSDNFFILEKICRDLKLPIQSRLIWHYRNAGGKSSGKFKFSKTYDPIIHIGNKELNFPEDWNDERFDVWQIAIPQSNFIDGKYHPTQKPLELYNRLIKFGSDSNDLILDPFAGSGTTGIVCSELRRNFILIEENPEYISVIKKRMGI